MSYFIVQNNNNDDNKIGNNNQFVILINFRLILKILYTYNLLNIISLLYIN